MKTLHCTVKKICHAVVWFDRLATICSSIVPKVSKESWCDEQTSHRYRQNRCTMILIFFIPFFLDKFKRIQDYAMYSLWCLFLSGTYFEWIYAWFFFTWQKQISIDIYQFWSQRSNFWTTATIMLNKILYKSVGIWAQCTLKYIKSSKFAQKLWSFRFPSPLHLLLCTMEFYGGIYYFSLNRSAAHQDIKNSTLFPVISKRNWMAVTFFKKEKKIIMQMKIGILAYIG